MTAPGCEKPGRAADPLEREYSFLAADLGKSEICEKISPEAHQAAAWGGDGKQLSFTRSNCYFNLALKTRDAGYCAKVESISTLWLDGSRISKKQCERDVADGKRFNSSGNPAAVLPLMGYGAGAMPGRKRCDKYPRSPSGLPKDMAERVRFLPDFSGGTVNRDELLSEAQAYDAAYVIRSINQVSREALDVAVRTGDLKCITDLVELGARLFSGEYQLGRAALYGRIEIVQLFLDLGVDPRGVKSGDAAIHSAAWGGHKEIVQLLLDAGSHVDVKDSWGQTPLWKAAAKGHVELARYLLELGADPAILDHQSHGGLSPLHTAARRGDIQTVEFLLAHGADATTRQMGSTPAEHAAVIKDPDTRARVIELLAPYN